MPRGAPALQTDTRPRDRAMPALHGSPRSRRQQNGRRRQTPRAWGVGRCLPGDGVLGPRETRGSLGRERLPCFRKAFASRDFCSCPRFRFSICMDGVFFRGWNIVIPPGYFMFSSLFLFWLSYRAFDSVRRSLWLYLKYTASICPRYFLFDVRTIFRFSLV